ncbi:MAG TPA: efflux RND transporter periplasmic adaptor subunit [Sphingomicrobium sp.]|nr:efflux RND transporter periplasmic adaptor subunit [Sphingomicrobium sp.]
MFNLGVKLVMLGAALASLVACGNAPPQAPAPPLVSAGYPIQRNVVDWDDYVGRFEAIQDVEVRPRVSGQIVRIGFRDGLKVGKGQFLFEIDPRPYAAALAQARADEARARATLANARAEFARAGALVRVGFLSREQYDEKKAAEGAALADLDAARAAVRQRALDLGFTMVRAPIAGQVSDKRVSLGDYVTAGQTLLTRVVTTDPIWFSFDGAESFYLKYSRLAEAGQRRSSRYAPNPVEIQLADEPNYRWRGRMVFVDNAIDTGSGTIRAHAVVANPNGFLVPGLFGRARLLGSGTYHALLIPDEAIVTDQTRRLVYVAAKDGKVATRSIETGPLVEGLRVVKSGLQPSDRVVLDGLARLQPGAAVRVKLIRIRPRAKDDAPDASEIEAPQAATAMAQ